MKSTVVFMALFLATPMFGQHGGGSRGAAAPGGGTVARRGSVGRPTSFAGRRPGLRQRFGTGLFSPFYPIGGDYWDGLLGYDDSYPQADNFPYIQFPYVQRGPVFGATAQPVVAQAVVNDYKWKDDSVAAAGNSSTLITIVLKDGTLRYAVATWVQDRQLHYIDSEDKQEVLSSDRIDRAATQRLNEEKKLHLQLPPG